MWRSYDKCAFILGPVSMLANKDYVRDILAEFSFGPKKLFNCLEI
jgi:hypothetical protein